MNRYQAFFRAGIAFAGVLIPLARGQAQRGTPRQCLQHVRMADRDIPRNEGGIFENPDSAKKLRRAAALECLRQFTPASVPADQLLSLAEIAVVAQDYPTAKTSIAERISSIPGDSARAQVFLQAILLLDKSDGSNRFVIAGQYVDALDSLAKKTKNNASRQVLVQAASILASRYNTGTQDDSSEKYARMSVNTSKLIPDSARHGVARYLLTAYTHLAEIAVTRGDLDEVQRILVDAQHELETNPQATEELAQLSNAYALLGKPAPALKASNWIDSSGHASPAELKNHATILAFGAHWCAPCRASYPSLISLVKKFKQSSLQLILVTQTYGYFGERTALTGAEEMSLDSSYFLKEHHLPAKLAIADVPKVPDEEGRVDPPPAPDERLYGVAGLPQTILIDRSGTVRAVYLGWNPANQGHIQNVLGQMLISQ